MAKTTIVHNFWYNFATKNTPKIVPKMDPKKTPQKKESPIWLTGQLLGVHWTCPWVNNPREGSKETRLRQSLGPFLGLFFLGQVYFFV